MPGFFVVGANKAGTTSLHAHLRQHPDIFMPVHKEPTYLALQYLAGKRLPPTSPYSEGLVYDWTSYRRLFEPGASAKAVGEASTAYLTSPHAPFAIRQHAPRARIIAVLRHPVDRAYSHFLMYRRDGLEPIDDFEAALAAEPNRRAEGWPDGYNYVGLGRYGAALRRYHEIVPGYRIRVYRFEQLRDDPHGLTRDVFEFLGVDPTVTLDLGHKLNVAPDRAALPSDVRERASALFREDLASLDTLMHSDYSKWLDS